VDPGRIFVRALFAYATFLLLLRISGKRVVGQATPFDFTLSLIVGDLFDDLFWADVSAGQFVAAVGALLLTDAAVKLAGSRSDRFFRLVEGTATVVLKDGSEQKDALRGEQLNEKDLEHLLRKEGIGRDRWKEVRLAVLERDHALGVLKQDWAETVQRRDAGRLRARRK